MLDENTEDLNKPNNINRRVLFAGVLAVPLAAPARASTDLYEQVERDAAALAGSMRAIQGGDWGILISYERGFVSVSRSLP